MRVVVERDGKGGVRLCAPLAHTVLPPPSPAALSHTQRFKKHLYANQKTIWQIEFFFRIQKRWSV